MNRLSKLDAKATTDRLAAK